LSARLAALFASCFDLSLSLCFAFASQEKTGNFFGNEVKNPSKKEGFGIPGFFLDKEWGSKFFFLILATCPLALYIIRALSGASGPLAQLVRACA
jgi:hypothetical protein